MSQAEFFKDLVFVDSDNRLQWTGSHYESMFDVHDPLALIILLNMTSYDSTSGLNYGSYFSHELDASEPLSQRAKNKWVAAQGESLGNMGLFRQFLRSDSFGEIKRTGWCPQQSLLVGALEPGSLYEWLMPASRLGWDHTYIDIVDPSPSGLITIERARKLGYWNWKGQVKTIQNSVCNLLGQYDFISADIVFPYTVPSYITSTEEGLQGYQGVLTSISHLLSPKSCFVSRTMSYHARKSWVKPSTHSSEWSIQDPEPNPDLFESRMSMLSAALGDEILSLLDPHYVRYFVRNGPFSLSRPEPMCGLAYLMPRNYAKMPCSFEEGAPIKLRNMYESLFPGMSIEELQVWDAKRQWLLQTFIVHNL